MYSSAFEWNVLKISVRSISSSASCKACVSLLMFCFGDLSIGASGMSKPPTIIVLLSASPFMSVSADDWVCIFVLFFVWMRHPAHGCYWWLGDARSCIQVVSFV